MANKINRVETILGETLTHFVSEYATYFNTINTVKLTVSEGKNKGTITKVSKQIKVMLLNTLRIYLTQVLGRAQNTGFSKWLKTAPKMPYEHVKCTITGKLLANLESVVNAEDAHFDTAQLAEHTINFMRYLKYVAFQYTSFYMINLSVGNSKVTTDQVMHTTKTYNAEYLFMDMYKLNSVNYNFMDVSEVESLAAVVGAKYSQLSVVEEVPPTPVEVVTEQLSDMPPI